MIHLVLPCGPDKWLGYLAQGWRLASELDRLPIADITQWNAGWPAVLLMKEERE